MNEYDQQNKVSGLEDDPYYTKDSVPCVDPNHNPPMFISIPIGKIYRHICPSCKSESILRPSVITC